MSNKPFVSFIYYLNPYRPIGQKALGFLVTYLRDLMDWQHIKNSVTPTGSCQQSSDLWTSLFTDSIYMGLTG